MDASMDLGDMVGKLEDEIVKLKRKIEILDRDCKDYLSKLETAGKWGQRLLEENADLKKKVKESNNVDIQELREEFKDSLRQLEAEITKLERENEALKAGGGAGGAAPKKIQRGMSDALAQNDEMMARIDELENDNRQLQRKLDQARDQIQSLDNDGGRGAVTASSKSGEGFHAKGVFQSAFGYIQRDRLHKKLEEEGQRADELEMQLTNLQDAQKKAGDTEEKLKREFAEIQKFAQQQRALKYGAQAQLQDIGMKNDNLQGEMLRMQQKLRKMEDAPNTAMGHNEKIQVLKGAAPALNSLYADLKAGVDDIAWLTTEDDSDDSGGGSGSDSSSEPGDPSMYSKYLDAVGKDAPDGQKLKLPKGITEESVEGEVGEVSSVPGGKSAYKGKEKSAYGGGGGKIASAYDTMSKRERKVVKMTINETHKKLMGAFRLIEVLQQHVAKLTEELEYLEGAASMAKKINFYMGLGFVFLSSGVVILFAIMISTCDK